MFTYPFPMTSYWKLLIFKHLNIWWKSLAKYCQNGLNYSKFELLQAHRTKTTLFGNVCQWNSFICDNPLHLHKGYSHKSESRFLPPAHPTSLQAS